MGMMHLRRTRAVVGSVAVAALLMAGCQTKDPATREDKPSQAVTQGVGNALMGGIICGLATMVSGGDGNAVATNATTCAMMAGIAGFAAGSVEDQKDRELLAEFEQAGLQVKVRENNLVLDASDGIRFPEGSAVPDGPSRARLMSLAKIVNRFDQRAIEVVGHASTDEYEGLAASRAHTVRRMLAANGVAPGRISTSSRGAREPLVTDTAPGSIYRNRRVEIFFVPVF